MIAVVNGRIITESGILEGKSVLIDKGIITSVNGDIPKCADIINADGNYVSPGFIDLHIHGTGGYDTMDGNYDSINSISKIIARHGTTSFLPTTMTGGIPETKKAVKSIKECMERGTYGAQVIGAHLEGPFINAKTKGAQDERLIKEPNIGEFLDIVDNDLSPVKRVTTAPELRNASELISFLVGHGITVSIGHSYGTYDEVIDGIGRGITHSTHLYNAMRAFNHREPGVVGAIFDSRITTEFIADGIHLHFASIRTALAVKGYDNCALITDAMAAADMKDGVYSLGGQDVIVRHGEAKLSGGTLAGSTLTMDTAVRNMLKNTSLSIYEIVSMASSVPARIIKLNETKGHIKPGYDADIIIFDQDINIKTTIVSGRIVY